MGPAVYESIINRESNNNRRPLYNDSNDIVRTILYRYIE